MKRLKRFFNKKFKRYSFVFLTLLSCLVILANPVSAANVEPFSILNVMNISYAMTLVNDSTVTFEGAPNGVVNTPYKLELPLKFQDSHGLVYIDKPIVITQLTENTNFPYNRYTEFNLKLYTLFGYRNYDFTNNKWYSPMNLVDDNKTYALSFTLVFLASLTNDSWAQWNFKPTRDYVFKLNYRPNINESTEASYILNYRYREVRRDSDFSDLYGYYDFYCEIPPIILKGASSITIEGVDSTGGSGRLFFGFPADGTDNQGRSSFKIVEYDPLTAPVYSVPYSENYTSFEETETSLRNLFGNKGLYEANQLLNSFNTILSRHKNSFLAAKTAMDNFFTLDGISSIVSIVSSVAVFMVLFKVVSSHISKGK